jgi:hypothetical protein
MLATWVLVCGSCVAWIGGITLALVYFLQLSPTIAWVIAGSLSLSSTIAITLIFRELRHAIVIPDDADLLEYDMFPVPARKPVPANRGQKKHSVPARSFPVPRGI